MNPNYFHIQGGRGNAASSSNSPLKSNSMTSTKATPIPRVATLSRSTTSTTNARMGAAQGGAAVHRTSSLSGAGSQGASGRGLAGTAAAAGSQVAATNQSSRIPAPPPGGGSRGRTTPQAWGKGRELPSVKEGQCLNISSSQLINLFMCLLQNSHSIQHLVICKYLNVNCKNY